MKLENIHRIIASNLWKRMKAHRGFRDHIIIDTICKRSKKRTEGQFFVLLVFFEHADEKTLRKFSEEGRKIGSKCEMLDPTEVYKFYGTMSMLRFS